MKRYAAAAAVAFLIGVTLFTVVRFIITQHENAYLNANLKSLNVRIGVLDSERQKLFQVLEKRTNEVAGLKAEMQRLATVEATLIQSQQTVNELTSEMSLVREENNELRNKQETLRQELSSVTHENAALQQRLNSLAELKKAIVELRHKLHGEHWHARESAQDDALEGNRGFLLRDGQTTYPTRVRIQVNPAH